MISVDIKGTLGKYGYKNIPLDIQDTVLEASVMAAYIMAINKAPYDPTPDGIHIKEKLKHEYKKETHSGAIWVALPYAFAAEYGTKKRFPHPFMRPAADAGKRKMKAIIRKATKEAIDKEKARNGIN